MIENNNQFKNIFNYNIFDKYFSKIFPWYKAVYGAIVFGVGILTVIFERYGQKGQAIFMLGGGVFLLIFWYAEKKKVCKMTIERFQDQYGIREIHGSCIFMNEYLLYQRDFKQEKKISYESFQKFYDLKEVYLLRTKLYMSPKKVEQQVDKLVVIFFDKEHMTLDERKKLLMLIREKMPQIRNGNR